MNRLSSLIKRALSYFPSKLPVGVSEYETWANSIIELAGQFADADSMKWALNNMVLHLPSTSASVPKNHFVKCLRKSAANQIVSAVTMDIKNKQAEAQAAAKLAEETAKLETTTSGQTSN